MTGSALAAAARNSERRVGSCRVSRAPAVPTLVGDAL